MAIYTTHGLYTLDIERFRNSEPLSLLPALGPGFLCLIPELRCCIFHSLDLTDFLSLRLVARGVNAYVGQFAALFASCLANTLDNTRPLDLAILFSVPYHPFKICLQLLFPQVRRSLDRYQLTFYNSNIREKLQHLDCFDVEYVRFLRSVYLRTYQKGICPAIVTHGLAKFKYQPVSLPSLAKWSSRGEYTRHLSDAIVPLYTISTTTIGTHVLCAVVSLRAFVAKHAQLMQRLYQLHVEAGLPTQALGTKSIVMAGKLMLPIGCWSDPAHYAAGQLQQEEDRDNYGTLSEHSEADIVAEELMVVPILFPSRLVTTSGSRTLKPRVVRLNQRWESGVDQMYLGDWQQEYIRRSRRVGVIAPLKLVKKGGRTRHRGGSKGHTRARKKRKKETRVY